MDRRWYAAFVVALAWGCQTVPEEPAWDEDPELAQATGAISHKREAKPSRASNQSELCARIVRHVGKNLRQLRQFLPKDKVGKGLAYTMAGLRPDHCRGAHSRITIGMVAKSVNQHSRKVGLLVPLSGRYRKLGKAVVAGMKAASQKTRAEFDEAFVIRDTAGSKARALAQLADLVFNHQVAVAIGGVTPEAAEAIIPYSRGLLLPLLVLNRDRSLIKDQRYAFQVYPNDHYLGQTLAQATVKRGARRVSILVPAGGKATLLAASYAEELDRLGAKVVHRLGYKSGDFESMNKAVTAVAGTEVSARYEEYAELFRETQEQAQEEGVAFNPRSVVLEPELRSEAVFIPDNFRIVHHFIKLLRYHGVTKDLLLVGNQQWRSMALVEPWQELLDGAIFADYIGSYRQVPQHLDVKTIASEYFVPVSDVVRVDFQLIGYYAGLITLNTLATPTLKRRHIVKHLARQRGSRSFFQAARVFDRERTSWWPTYVFSVKKAGIRLISRYAPPKKPAKR